eukprot:gene2310-3034_t
MHYYKDLPLDESDVLEPTVDVPNQIEGILDTEAQEFDIYQEKMERYKKLMKMLNNHNISVYEIPGELLLEFGDENGNILPPQHKYGGKRPVIAAFFDDTQDTDMMRPSSKLSNMVIKHRHLGKLKDSALGITLLFACQNYTSSSGGLLKSIRGNLTHMLVFRNKNQKEIDKIGEEVGGEIPIEEFNSVYNQAIQGPHDFLFIDLHRKPSHPSMFRRNFNEWIIPDQNQQS